MIEFMNPSRDLAKARTDLAQVRTDLANQRTLLAYMRTSLSFFIAAAALSKLYVGFYIAILCVGLCIAGLIFLFAGIRVYRFYRTI